MSTGKADSPQPIATISQTLAQRVQGVGRRLSSVQVWKGVYGLDLPRRNVRYLEVEVFWAAFLSAAATFSAALLCAWVRPIRKSGCSPLCLH